MRIAITAAETSDNFALTALAAWLRTDPDVRRQAMVTERPSGTVELALRHAGAVTSILLAYGAWRTSRADRPAVMMRVRGVPVRLDGPTPEAAAWIEALLTVDPELVLGSRRG
ncbi:effector-associated constant component EACC1 [Paractinoplanes rishiriensis]|uniref:effector-associated constant component EACC1 n=1 Tax=Paractinoplanes rishiriensis TaxID=1050105 RepID=UPI00194407A8|nr:hypothetical protein [Actinoplanes rishiriensis]